MQMSNEACYLVIKFKGDEINWIHPIQLNGRIIDEMYVDGAQVERVVRCADCKHYRGVMTVEGSMHTCSGVMRFVNVNPDDFCAWGAVEDGE